MAKLGDDDRPTEQRDDDQHENGDLAFGRRTLEGELERAGAEHRGRFDWVHNHLLGRTKVTRPVVFASNGRFFFFSLSSSSLFPFSAVSLAVSFC